MLRTRYHGVSQSRQTIQLCCEDQSFFWYIRKVPIVKLLILLLYNIQKWTQNNMKSFKNIKIWMNWSNFCCNIFHFLLTRKHTTNTKNAIYMAWAVGMLCYGRESWSLAFRQERYLSTFHLGCLRRILTINWSDRVTNTVVLTHVQLPSIYFIKYVSKELDHAVFASLRAGLDKCTVCRLVGFQMSFFKGNWSPARGYEGDHILISKRSAKGTWGVQIQGLSRRTDATNNVMLRAPPRKMKKST